MLIYSRRFEDLHCGSGNKTGYGKYR